MDVLGLVARLAESHTDGKIDPVGTIPTAQLRAPSAFLPLAAYIGGMRSAQLSTHMAHFVK